MTNLLDQPERGSTMRAARASAFLILILPLCLGAGRARGQAAVYIVRHAERAPGSGDVPLSEQGLQRAANLAELLRRANVSAIYTSDALRTQQTAAPLAELRDIIPIIIADGDPTETFEQIGDDHPNDVVLIVAHSNTVGPLIKKWAPDAEVTIAADEFDAIFVITPTDAKAGWARFRYSAEAP